MIELADRIPEEHLQTFKEILDGFTEAFNSEEETAGNEEDIGNKE